MLGLKECASKLSPGFLKTKISRAKLKASAAPFLSLDPNRLKVFYLSSRDLGALGASGGFLGQSLALLNGGVLGEDQKRNDCSFSVVGGWAYEGLVLL